MTCCYLDKDTYGISNSRSSQIPDADINKALKTGEAMTGLL